MRGFNLRDKGLNERNDQKLAAAANQSAYVVAPPQLEPEPAVHP